MTIPITPELAKLVKEKGFDDSVLRYYTNNGELKYVPSDFIKDYHGYHVNGKEKHWYSDKHNFPYYAAPTIMEVVGWIYKKHKIWIMVDAGINGFYGHYKINPIGTLSPQVEQGWTNSEEFPFKEPEEAYEGAIKYVLKNLIK